MSEPRPRITKHAVASLVTGVACLIVVAVAIIALILFGLHSNHHNISDGLDSPAMLLLGSLLVVFLAVGAGIAVISLDIIFSKAKRNTIHPATLAGLGALLLALVLCFPWISVFREQGRRISCSSNLKSLGLALRMYSSDWHEQFPPMDGAAGLELLRSQGYCENHKMYTCPCTKTLCGQGYETFLAEDIVDYVYWGGYTEADDVAIPVMLDKPDNHRDYGNALFIDGHVSGFYGKDWEAIQAEAKAWHGRVVGPRREKHPEDAGN
jgi:prepilin-type processing-associated H-X9-DG protein